MTIKYLKSDLNKDDFLYFGVSKENHNSESYLGSLQFDWSVNLYDGNIYHNQHNKDQNKDKQDKDFGTVYGYYSKIGDEIECWCD